MNVICLVLLLCFPLNILAQDVECYSAVCVDWQFKGSIPLYDSPNGKIIKYLKNDVKNEDYIEFEVHYKKGDMYYVTAIFFFQENISGWIYLNDSIGVFSRAYQGNLKLYEGPTENSKVSCIIEEYDPGLYSVIECCKDWLKVKRVLHGKTYVGWMPPEMQCPNSYTTCP